MCNKIMRILNKILFGNFLINRGVSKNWKLVACFFVMAIIMIFSSHSIDKKIILISDLKNNITNLESQFIENRQKVMKLRMETNVALSMREKEIKNYNNPPLKIIVY